MYPYEYLRYLTIVKSLRTVECKDRAAQFCWKVVSDSRESKGKTEESGNSIYDIVYNVLQDHILYYLHWHVGY